MSVALAEERNERIQSIIMGWNFETIKQVVSRETDLTEEELDELEIEYKRYLLLRTFYPDTPIPISEPVDKIWHTHLLFTRDYQSLCEKVGVNIHHRPYKDEEELDKHQQNYQRNTIPLYEKHFDDIDRRWWPENKAICWDG